MKKLKIPPVSLILVLFSLTPIGAQSVEWPGWRGPGRDGRISGKAWPRSLTDGASLERVWRVELGPSYSGPVVSRGAVFVTETSGGHEVVRALDRRGGKELWTTRWSGSMEVPFFAKENGSWIRSTPFFDGERLYVAGMRDVLLCLDARTGAEIWRVDFMERFSTPLPSFGFVCSPLVAGGHVYVQAGASVVKLDKLSGETIWRALEDEGGMNGSAFSSPILAELRGTSQLLVQARRNLAGIDPRTGAVLWSREIPAFRGMNIQTPTLDGNRIFLSSYGGGSRLVEIARNGEAFETRELWDDTAQGYMSTPVIVGGHAYLHLRNQRLTCFDLESGKRAWTSSERFGKYMSLVSQGDLILALDERGILYLWRASPEKLEILDEKKVSDAPTWAHLAVSGGELIVRELNAVAVFRWRPADGGSLQSAREEKTASSSVASERPVR